MEKGTNSWSCYEWSSQNWTGNDHHHSLQERNHYKRNFLLDYALYPTEAAANYEEMMESIKKRGVKQVLLFASDGLAGMRDAVKRQFPEAEHQQSSLPSTENAIRNLQESSNVPRKVCIRFTNFRRQSEKAFTLQIRLRGATKGWCISPRSKSSFLMKMHLSASYAAIIVIWIVPTLSGRNVASVKSPPKYYNCLKKNFKPPINKM